MNILNEENRSSQIANIKSLVEILGDYDKLWEVLLGRNVVHVIKGQGKVTAFNRDLSEIRVDFEIDMYSYIGNSYSGRGTRHEVIRYNKNVFIQEFDEIEPPFQVDEILKRVKAIEDEERRRAQVKQRELKRQLLLEDLKKQIKQNFLTSDLFYKSECLEYISLTEYKAEKLNFVKNWINYQLRSQVDSEQAAAIATVEGHVQVVARAGSGKTTTLVNRALFLQKHCGIAPNEMLLLAFNRKAVKEIQERLTKKLKDTIPHVMTFHALAYALVHPEEAILFDEPNGAQSRSRTLQSIIDDHIRNPAYYEEIRALMIAHFRKDWERIARGGYDKSPEEILRYRRSLPREGIDGTYVKSFGEKVIADFLFEHDIKYKYERNFWWDGINYRPDFTIGERQGIIIEYFGLQGDPDYDAQSNEKRNYWRNQSNWHLLEFSPNDFRNGGVESFCSRLKQSLEQCGVSCNRLSEQEIWSRVKVRAIDRFTKAMMGFIQRCRKQLLTPQELTNLIDSHSCASDVEQRFLELAQVIYQAYLNHLQTTGEDDFDGLLQQATSLIESGQTVFRRRSGTGDLKSIRFILIDEYQDFSNLFHFSIKAIRRQNPKAQFFCVGDDWQAINGFAGSDLRFYQNFAQFFQPSQKLTISTNYRSVTSVVDLGNILMHGLGTPACAYKTSPGKIEIADLNTFESTTKEIENHQGDILTPSVLRLVNKVMQEGKKVVLLSRKSSLPWYVNYGSHQRLSRENTIDNFLELLRSYLPEQFREDITISTAHKYKGLEREVVILLDAIPRCYPLLHPDLIFTHIFGDTIKKVVDEERRLFYVALTRAIEHLFIITETPNFSPFLEELQGRTTLQSVNWYDYPPLIGEVRHIIVTIKNQGGRGGGTYRIYELLRNQGYIWNGQVRTWSRTYPAQNFSIRSFFNNSNWLSHAHGIEVQFLDETETLLAMYSINNGHYVCVIDNMPNLD